MADITRAFVISKEIHDLPFADLYVDYDDIANIKITEREFCSEILAEIAAEGKKSTKEG